MAWGGSLNKEGSDYIRNMREADKVIKFLEKLKQELNNEEKQIVEDAINLLVNHYTKESKNET
jgi:hypothetical protein